MHIEDTMISIPMMTPPEVAQYLAKQLQAKRLNFNLSQQTLAQRSGVSYGVLKKFERTGKISLESLLKLALTLGSLEEFTHLFVRDKPEQATSLDELMKDKTRKRGHQ
jgi:transcriptional regulator with XRE-family HTH domain